MPELHTLTVDEAQRLDQVLAQHWDALDRATIRALITEGAVLLNGVPARKAGQRLTPGDVVEVALPELAPAEAPELPVGMALQTVYEDEVLWVVDKPSGVPVRPTRRAETATVSQLLAAASPSTAHVGGANRAGVVTTLDDVVSGLVLVAKDETTYRDLRRLVKHEGVTQAYTALIEGDLRGEFMIDEPIGNVKRTRGRLAVAREGRPARTFVRAQQHYKESGLDYTLIYVRPESARMHQIRVHLAWYGFPVVGDRIYGSRRQPILPDRPFLHLSALSLRHPATGEPLEVQSPLPQELRSVLSYMRRPKIS